MLRYRERGRQTDFASAAVTCAQKGRCYERASALTGDAFRGWLIVLRSINCHRLINVNNVLKRVLQAVCLLLGFLVAGTIIISIIYATFGDQLLDETIKEYHPPKLLKGCPQLPVSSSEQSNDVIAKFDVDHVQVDCILECYKEQGFNTYDGGSQIYGFGPHGVSFDIFTTNHVRTLVVKQWKDM